MIRLTDEEISRAAYQRNPLFEENAVLAYTRKPDADRCIAKAQLKKVVEEIERNCRGYEDRTVGDLLTSAFWQALKKEVEDG